MNSHQSKMVPRSMLQWFAIVLTGVLFAASGAQAAPRKQAVDKKHQVSSKRPAAKSSATRKLAVRGKAPRVVSVSARTPVRMAPPRQSFGELAGFHHLTDPLDLKSSVALVVDQDTHEVLLSKNDQAVLPIASLTKLMTGLIISQAGLPMDEAITITEEDIDTEKGSRSRLVVGTTLSRREMLHLALMSSENRAANALGRTYPGGLKSFVTQMNVKARLLGQGSHCGAMPCGELLAVGLVPLQVHGARDDGYALCGAHRSIQSQPVQRPGLGGVGQCCPQ